jgi:hypothetical protein
MNGLIEYLAQTARRGMVAPELIEVRASSTEGGSGPDKVVDRNPNTYLHSERVSGQWFGIDFKTMRVKPTYYTMLGRNDKHPNDRYPRSWVLEGSDAGFDGPWTRISTQNNRSEVNGPGACFTFRVDTILSCRFIRLRLTDKPWGLDRNFEGLVLAGLELFGTLTVA